MRNPLLIEAADAAQGRNATGVFPKIYVPSERCDGPVGVEYFLEHGAALKQELKEKGALLFRGCGVNSAEDFEAVLDAVPFENMPYLGGAAPRRQITHRRIMTANESPRMKKYRYIMKWRKPVNRRIIFFSTAIPRRYPVAQRPCLILEQHLTYLIWLINLWQRS